MQRHAGMDSDMTHLLTIGWFLWLIVAVLLVQETARISALIRMFPEGWTWWAAPSQHVALAHFAVCVLLNPWGQS